jgi:redox-sensitive bicupin YhaK (pirin superfamily)
VLIHQDARVYAGVFDGAERAELALPAARRAWVHVARGALSLDDTRLAAGDGAGSSGPLHLTLHAGEAAEVLVFDLP